MKSDVCGCWGQVGESHSCSIHAEIGRLIMGTKQNWRKIKQLVDLGYRINGQGVLPAKHSMENVKNE